MASDLTELLRNLSPEDERHLGHLLLARYQRRTRKLTVEEAREAVHGASITAAWQTSRLADVGRLRAAAKELVLDGWEPEQIATALATVGLEDVFPEGRVIAHAIAAGFKDARRLWA